MLIASRIFCEPDSMPIQTSAQPARLRDATVDSEKIGAGLDFKWKWVSIGFYGCGERFHPA